MSEACAAAERLKRYCKPEAVREQCGRNAGALPEHAAGYKCQECEAVTVMAVFSGAYARCIACGGDAYLWSYNTEILGVAPGGQPSPPAGDIKFRLAAPEGYGPLSRVLTDALMQAAEGKGKERHATGEPFINQPIMSIARAVGEGYQLGQAIKKLIESQRLTTDRAIAERLGAINYIAASILLLEEERDALKD